MPFGQYGEFSRSTKRGQGSGQTNSFSRLALWHFQTFAVWACFATAALFTSSMTNKSLGWHRVSMVWVTALDANEFGPLRPWSWWAGAFWKIVVHSAAAGPGGARASLLWNLDEQLLRKY